MKTTVYSKSACMQCKMVKNWLTDRGIEFEEINLDEQPEYRTTLTNLGLKSAPITHVVLNENEDKYILGFAISELREVFGVR